MHHYVITFFYIISDNSSGVTAVVHAKILFPLQLALLKQSVKSFQLSTEDSLAWPSVYPYITFPLSI
jgi:hypothetical protein